LEVLRRAVEMDPDAGPGCLLVEREEWVAQGHGVIEILAVGLAGITSLLSLSLPYASVELAIYFGMGWTEWGKLCMTLVSCSVLYLFLRRDQHGQRIGMFPPSLQEWLMRYFWCNLFVTRGVLHGLRALFRCWVGPLPNVVVFVFLYIVISFCYGGLTLAVCLCMYESVVWVLEVLCAAARALGCGVGFVASVLGGALVLIGLTAGFVERLKFLGRGGRVTELWRDLRRPEAFYSVGSWPAWLWVCAGIGLVPLGCVVSLVMTRQVPLHERLRVGTGGAFSG